MSKGILNNFDIKENFWKTNKQLVIPEQFSKFKYDDRSRDKEESSDIMWAIALLIDPDSKFVRLPLQQRKDIIAKDFLKKPKFDWDKYRDIIELYKKLMLTPAQRQLAIWEEKLDEKTQLMSETKYTIDNAELLEKLLGSNSKLFAELDRIKEQLERDEDLGSVKGGSIESASEIGII